MTPQEKRNAYARKWRAANRDKVAAAQKRYKQAHRGHLDQKQKAWVARNPEKAKETARRSRAKNQERQKQASREAYWNDPAAARLQARAYRFRVPVALLVEMNAAQGGRCAICKCKPSDGRALHLDHDHGTDKPRALLCVKCNCALGLVEENRDTLTAMIAYIDHHEGN